MRLANTGVVKNPKMNGSLAGYGRCKQSGSSCNPEPNEADYHRLTTAKDLDKGGTYCRDAST